MFTNDPSDLIGELARIDEQIAEAEAITVAECYDDMRQRASEIPAVAREIRRDVEGRLRAE